MNIQDLQEKLRAARISIKHRVSPTVGKRLMIIAGGITLLAGGAGAAMAVQSHAQVRNGTAQVQTVNAADQSTTGSATGAQREKPAAVGTVTAVSGSTLTVADTQSNTTYTVDASAATVTKVTSTTSSKPTETTISVSDIAVGDTVMIQGTVTGTSVTATTIRDGQDFGGMHGSFGGGKGNDAARGTVTAISGSTVTITDKQSNTTYTVDASTATVTKITAPATQGTKPTETTIAVSAIAAGDTVSVQGTVAGTTVTATKIEDGQFFDGMRGGPGDMHGRKPATMGTVTAVSGNTVTLTDTQSGTSYTVDASNAKVTKVTFDASATATSGMRTKPTETTISASEIAVGDTVMIQGTVTGSSVAATAITDGNFPTPPARGMGGRGGKSATTTSN